MIFTVESERQSFEPPIFFDENSFRSIDHDFADLRVLNEFLEDVKATHGRIEIERELRFFPQPQAAALVASSYIAGNFSTQELLRGFVQTRLESEQFFDLL